MTANLVPQLVAARGSSQYRAAILCALGLATASFTSCDDGIGHPIEAGVTRAGASGRYSTTASTARGNGGFSNAPTVAGSSAGRSTASSGTGGVGSSSVGGGNGSGSNETGGNGQGGTSAAVTAGGSSATNSSGGNASGGISSIILLLGMGGLPVTRTETVECNPTESWPEEWAKKEYALANLIDLLRFAGLECGTLDRGPERSALDDDNSLRCFAREYSLSRSINEPPAVPASFQDAVVIEVQTAADLSGGDMAIGMWTNDEPTDCRYLMSNDFGTMEVGFAAASNVGYWTIALMK